MFHFHSHHAWRGAFCSLLMAGAAIPASAAPLELMGSFKTAIEELGVEGQTFSFCLSSMQEQTIVVDDGYTQTSYIIPPTVDGTFITLGAPDGGRVDLYGDPTLIDYFYCQGGYLTEADLSQMVNLSVLDLSHNELEILDLSTNIELAYIDVSDNKFVNHPLIIGPKPKILALELNNLQTIDPNFNLSDYPTCQLFTAWALKGLTHLDPSGCPDLLRLSIDSTPVETLDVTMNPKLRILNISDTRIRDIDLTKCPQLGEFYCNRDGGRNWMYGLNSLDLSQNPLLYYLFLNNNGLETIDLSHNPQLFDVSLNRNKLTSIDLTGLERLTKLSLTYNDLTIATLPPAIDAEGYELYQEYNYRQNAMKVNRTYKVGDQIDLSASVLRQGWEVYMTVLTVSEDDPANPVEIDPADFSWNNGILTLNRALPDSVYAEFYTPMLPECPFRTTAFKVKSAEDFGKPVEVISFLPGVESGKEFTFGLGMAGASQEKPVEVLVDFGDGVLKPVGIQAQTGVADNVTGALKGGQVKVYTDQEDEITSFIINGVQLYGLDVTKAPTLRELTVTGAGLYALDLKWNRCLRTLKLNGNHFPSFSLAGANSGYEKNVLGDIDLSSNDIETITLNEPATIHKLNLSTNNLEEIGLTTAYYMTDLDLSFNRLEMLNLGSLDALERLNVAGNNIDLLAMPEMGHPVSVDIRSNRFDFTSLPAQPGQIAEYLYAPQQRIEIATMGPGCNLSGQNVDIEGNQTTYAWFNAETGEQLAEGTDYTLANGRTRFLKYDLGTVYCAMENAGFPDFTGENALMTTNTLVAAPPTNEIGSMLTMPGSDNPWMSLASNLDKTAIYIDWKGDGKDYDEYLLGSTYRVFPMSPVNGKTARIYTYEPEDNLTVFSIHNVKVAALDIEKMNKLVTLNLDNIEAQSIKFPAETGNLRELMLTNGDYATAVPLLKRYTNLYTLYLQLIGLTEIDLSDWKQLGYVSVAGNYISKLTLDNPDIWALDASFNELAEIDLSRVPAMHQLNLVYNQLEEIKLENMDDLSVLFLDFNAFDFTTLPLPRDSWSLYTYSNQAMLYPPVRDGVVNLADQAWVDDYETTFMWFNGTPWFDEEGNLAGDLLEEGKAYEIKEGVTTFLTNQRQAMCVMTNEAYPALYLVTGLLDIELSGVGTAPADTENIRVDGLTVEVLGSEGLSTLWTVDGLEAAKGNGRLTAPAPGLYILQTPATTRKLNLR